MARRHDAYRPGARNSEAPSSARTAEVQRLHDLVHEMQGPIPGLLHLALSARVAARGLASPP